MFANRLFTASLLVLTLAFSATVRAADDVDTLKKKRQAVEAKLGEENEQLRQLRRNLAKDADLAAAYKTLADAKAAYDQKVTSDPKVTAAAKAQTDATAAARQATDTALATNPEVVAAQKEITTASDAADDAESDLRIANYVQLEMKHKAARDPELKKLFAETTKADAAMRAVPGTAPSLAAPFKAVTDARRAYDEEKGAAQRTALDSAQKALDEAVKGSKEAGEAKAARDTAQKAYDEHLLAKLNASPEGQAQVKKIQDLEQKVKDARAAAKTAGQKLIDAQAKATKSDPKIAEARTARESVTTDYRKAVDAATAAEKTAVDEAQKAVDTKLQSKLAADPKAAEIKKQIEDLSKQSHDLGEQITRYEKAV